MMRANLINDERTDVFKDEVDENGGSGWELIIDLNKGNFRGTKPEDFL